ncbi:minor capsid protein [Gemella sp. 19428wG2_WT2a]|nr:minor capsid protein [Gemella sp. 19428wG2_WT2a]TFU57690.1 phage head morphogenesis protein [Gemella sp. WT2a]
MTYWTNRRLREIKEKQKAELSLDVQLQDLYDRYKREIEKEINDFYMKYAVRNNISLSEARKRVSEMDVQAFSEKARRYVNEKKFSKEANEELAVYNLKMKVSRLEMLQYNIDLQLLGLSEEETRLAEQFLNKEYKKDIRNQAGILGKSVGNAADTQIGINVLLERPFNGVTWKTGLTSQQSAIRKVVAKSVEDLIVKGKNPTTYISQLTKDLNIKKYEAKRLLVTEAARIQTEVQKASYEEADYEEYIYLAETKSCKLCGPLHEKKFKVKDMQPGKNACPMHPHCKCSTAPYFDSDKAINDLIAKHKAEQAKKTR